MIDRRYTFGISLGYIGDDFFFGMYNRDTIPIELGCIQAFFWAYHADSLDMFLVGADCSRLGSSLKTPDPSSGAMMGGGTTQVPSSNQW